MGTVWIGVWLSACGIVLSLAILVEAAVLLFFELAGAPALPVVPPIGGNAAGGVSALQIAELLIDLLILTGEVAILNLSLYLLFRIQVLESIENRDTPSES